MSAAVEQPAAVWQDWIVTLRDEWTRRPVRDIGRDGIVAVLRAIAATLQVVAATDLVDPGPFQDYVVEALVEFPHAFPRAVHRVGFQHDPWRFSEPERLLFIQADGTDALPVDQPPRMPVIRPGGPHQVAVAIQGTIVVNIQAGISPTHRPVLVVPQPRFIPILVAARNAVAPKAPVDPGHAKGRCHPRRP